MDAPTFLDNFATIADAPGGGSRLRDLVLDLAVTGGLVSQSPAEGTGRAVVEHGAAFISDAVAKGWTRRRSVPEPTADEIPFPIPGNWAWARLPAVTHGLGQLTPDRAFTYLDVSSVNGEEGSLHGSPAVLAPDQAPSRARKAVGSGTVLYSTIRPYLRNVVHIERDFDPPAIASTAFAVLHPVPGLDPRYLKLCVRSTYFSRFVESRQKGVAYPAINDGDLAYALLPIPPLAEQERIVAKLDELTGLCDDLEARQARRHRASTHFRASALHALSEAEGPDDLHQAWERVESRLQTFTVEPDAINDLRHTILQLAITGKLSASSERADADRPVALAVNEAPGEFPLPPGWTWREFGQLCERITVGHVGPMSNRYVSAGIPFLRSQNVDRFRYEPGNLKYIDSEFHAELEKSALHGGEVISVRSGNVGRTCVFPEGQGPANCADLVIMRVGPQLNPHYAAIVMNSPYGMTHVSSKKVGIAQAHFNVGSAKRMPTPVPPIEVQSDLVQVVQRLLRVCDELEASLRLQRRRAELLAAATPKMAEART
jgi:type I restriction enzyme S subunit